MTPQQKCVLLETAKRLKEAGFPQKTEKMWGKYLGSPHLWDGLQMETFDYNKMGEDAESYRGAFESWIAAPDATELLTELERKLNWIEIYWNDSGCFWEVIIDQINRRGYGNGDTDNLAESLAHAYILLEKPNN